jgi:hypothetical protein
MNFTIFCPFWGIFATLEPSFYYLKKKSGFQKNVLKDVIHTVILAFCKKVQKNLKRIL